MKKKIAKLPDASPLPAPLARPIVATAKAINKIAMLCKLSVRSFCGKMKDVSLTREVIAQNGIKDATKANVQKQTMGGDELNRVINAAAKIRNRHAELTRPWFKGSVGALPSANFISAKQEMDKLIEEFWNGVENFINSRDKIIERDKKDLSTAFDISDYPSKEELRAKFNVFVEYFPIPTNDDFRVEGLSDAVIEQIRADMEKGIMERMREGDTELLQRLKDEIAHLTERLTVKNKNGQYGFKQNSLDNIKEVAAQVATLNIGENDKIASLCDKLASDFDFSADLIRENDETRKEKVSIAEQRLKEIEKAMSGLV